MRPSEDCVELLKRLEGFRAHPYRCAGGRWTIGYGSTTWHDGLPVFETDGGIGEAEAAALLRDTVAKVWGSVQGMARVPLTQGQADALTMLAFNIGETALRGSTLLAMLNAGDHAGAAKEFDRWNKAKGRVLKGLVKRRALERRMFEKG